jgi:putative tricarboxylic transport membrane protein
MYLGNLILLGLNLPLIPFLARLVNLTPRLLIPLVMAFALLGVYLTTLNPFDLSLMLGLAVLALALRWFGFPMAPLLLGFILSGLLEENVRRTLFLSDDTLWIVVQRPASLTIGILCLALWSVPALRTWRRHGLSPQESTNESTKE